MEELNCPICGDQKNYINVGKTHWGYCKNCEVKWNIGYGLFSDYIYESADKWKENEEFLSTLKEVK